MNRCILFSLASALMITGCAYRWTSSVPLKMRTVAVPVFENDTNFAEFNAIASQYVLREFQREGTLTIKPAGSAVLEVQGKVKNISRTALDYDRNIGSRTSEYAIVADVEVSLIDKRNGKVLFNNRKYQCATTFTVRDDLLTSQRNASERLAADLARQVVDDVLYFDYTAKDK